MKKIKDVFKLPVYVDKYGLNNAEHHTLIHDDAAESEKLEAIATAINHVDALADALEAVLKTPRGTSGRIILEKKDEDAVRTALAAYRGEA